MKKNYPTLKFAILVLFLTTAFVLTGCNAAPPDTITAKRLATTPAGNTLKRYYDPELNVYCYVTGQGISCLQITNFCSGPSQ